MKIDLPYGRKTLTALLPDGMVQDIVAVNEDEGAPPSLPEQIRTVEEALRHPVGSPLLSDLARGKKNIVYLASDHTRPVPSRILFPAMLAEIKKGAPDAVVTVLIATGSHRPMTRGELEEKFGGEFLARPDIVFAVHKCREDETVRIGTLPSGGPLLINRIAVDAGLLVAEGFIEPHFFAGFSGGRKSVLPGIAGAETVAANHCSAFIDSPFARTGVLAGNPIHRDMLYAADAARLAFIVNVVLGKDKEILGAFAGAHEAAHAAGCRFAAARAAVSCRPSEIVITTNGGYPLDQNIYQSVKGMTAAEEACVPGGAIIICAACEDGHGEQSFCDLLTKAQTNEQLMEQFMETKPEKTPQDQWQVQILLRILMHYRVIMVTETAKELTEALRMTWAPDLSSALAIAREHCRRVFPGKVPKVNVIPDGVSVIVRKA